MFATGKFYMQNGGYDRYKRGADTYDSGDHYCICDRCGFKVRRSQARRTWDNLIVCPHDYEARHPQDYIRTFADQQSVAEPRSEGVDRFVGTNEVQPDDL